MQQLPDITLQGSSLEVLQYKKYLGLYKHLSWKVHIDDLCTSLKPKLGALSRLVYILPQQLLKVVYNTTIQSKIDYGLPLWGHVHSTYVETIQKMKTGHAGS